jgi:hypothetical protein
MTVDPVGGSPSPDERPADGSAAVAATVDPPDPHRPGPGFWVAMAVGGATTLFGAIGLLRTVGDGLGSFITFFVGGALLIDLVVVPIASGVGRLGRRCVPAAAWPAVRAGLVATSTLVLFAAPLVAGVGGKPDNPSLRPRDYRSGLSTAVVAVWLGCLSAAAIAAAVSNRRASGTSTN